ncbi:hypothetical protein AURDEDRAFT_178869 [Auricularia subglabra TFB-10046 SS5]|nr:hypothetical protein AURDEDRAFT_178869 [Auricularia subglabra TFB-10046 SS5]
MATGPRELAYTFTSPLDPRNALGQTFSLTLTGDVLMGVGKISVKYYLNDTPIARDTLQDTFGIMGCTVTAVPGSGPGFSQRQTRYILSFQEATSYLYNPRNLEAPWKPVYRIVLLEVIENLDTCDVREEMPIWIIYDARDQMPLTETVSMPRGGGKTVFPDLCVVMHRGTIHRAAPPFPIPSYPILCTNAQEPVQSRFVPVLCELKRAISRSLTVNGYPDPAKPEATYRLADSFTAAQEQIELTAYLHLVRNPDQTHAVLIAAVGPWFRGNLVSRDDIVKSSMQGRHELDIAAAINTTLEKTTAPLGTDGSDDPPNENEAMYANTNPAMNYEPGTFDDLSEIPGWGAPMMLGSPEAGRFWVSLRETIYTMLSGMTPPTLIR